MGGELIIRFTLNLKIWAHFKFSLYLPIIWLFWMGSHWLHWKAKSSLWALAVLNGGVNCQIYPKSENLSLFQVFLISSYYLTVSNGLSLTALKSIELTQRSGSFKWGVHLPLVFPYIFLLVDCFEWVLIGAIEKHRVDSVLWQFWVGGLIIRFTLNLNIWAPGHLGVLINKVFSLYAKTNKDITQSLFTKWWIRVRGEVIHYWCRNDGDVFHALGLVDIIFIWILKFVMCKSVPSSFKVICPNRF